MQSIASTMPSEISYDGTNLYYSIDNQNYSEALDFQDRQILDWVQDGLSDVLSHYGLGPLPKVSTNSQKNPPDGNTPIQSWSNSRVIEFLENKGYEVKHLIGKQFEITKHYDESEGLSATHIFNAATGRIEGTGKANAHGHTIAEINKNRNANGQNEIQTRHKRSGKNEVSSFRYSLTKVSSKNR